MKKHTQKSWTGGAAVITVVLIFLALSSLITSASSRIVLGEASRSQSYSDSQERYRVAESAAEDVAYRLKKGFSVASSETVVVASTSALISSTLSGGVRRVGATSTSPRATRSLGLDLFRGEGSDFFYGIQAGSLGFSMSSNSTVTGNVYSNGTITGASGAEITGSASAVSTISSPDPVVTGASTPGSSVIPLPSLDIEYWKVQANIHDDPYVGDLTFSGGTPFALGPRKIVGNLVVTSNAQLTVTGPLYVTGTMTISSNADLFLDQSFGSDGTVILVDGTVTIESNADIHATDASPKGYILLASLSAGTAIDLNSNTASALLYAPNGTVVVNSNAHATSIAAEGILLNSNASITYDSGLENQTFTSGPSGGWRVQRWQETE